MIFLAKPEFKYNPDMKLYTRDFFQFATVPTVPLGAQICELRQQLWEKEGEMDRKEVVKKGLGDRYAGHDLQGSRLNS